MGKLFDVLTARTHMSALISSARCVYHKHQLTVRQDEPYIIIIEIIGHRPFSRISKPVCRKTVSPFSVLRSSFWF